MGNLCICEAAASDVADPLLFGGQRPWAGDEVSIVRYPPLLESIPEEVADGVNDSVPPFPLIRTRSAMEFKD